MGFRIAPTSINILVTNNYKNQAKDRGVDASTPARAVATVPTVSPVGSSTLTTTRRASSCTTPPAQTTPIRLARPPTLKAEVNEEAWETLRSDTSRPFDRPISGRIAVKVINHLGDEVMKVFRV
ncbi:MAG: hypothetical protein OXC09_00035 [Truepera sp.]|nr:hypothetical protein [Truepera sp.]